VNDAIHSVMPTCPKSPKEMTKGMMYFPRMLTRFGCICAAKLHEDYQENFGALKAADGVCSNFLRVHHRDLIQRVKQGGTDEEILEWCFEKGRRLNDGDLFVGTDSHRSSDGAIQLRRRSNDGKRRWESPIAAKSVHPRPHRFRRRPIPRCDQESVSS